MLFRSIRLALGRQAKPLEVQRIVALYQAELNRYKTDVASAALIANAQTGEDAAELAAWTVVANVILNMDEFVTKG